MQNKLNFFAATISLLLGVAFFAYKGLDAFLTGVWGQRSCGLMDCMTFACVSCICLIIIISAYVSFVAKRGRIFFAKLAAILTLIFLFFVIFFPDLVVMSIVKMLMLF